MSDDEDKVLDAIVLFGIRVADLPDPHVPSVPYPCDMCGAPIWLSQQTVNKVSEVMVMDKNQGSSIVYLCHEHDGEMPEVDSVEYGCPACPGDVMFHTRDEVIAHYQAEHMP